MKEEKQNHKWSSLLEIIVMIQVSPILWNEQANKQILKQSSTQSNKAPRNLPMAFVSLTLDAHDNGSSIRLKLESLVQEYTHQKIP